MNSNAILALLIEDMSTAAEFQWLRSTRRAQIEEIYRSQRTEGCFKILIERHLIDNDTRFQAYFRLTPYLFDRVLSIVKVDLEKKSTNANPLPLTPEQKLCLTLRFLATGETYRSLAFQFRISPSYISVSIREVLKAIIQHLQAKTTAGGKGFLHFHAAIQLVDSSFVWNNHAYFSNVPCNQSL